MIKKVSNLFLIVLLFSLMFSCEQNNEDFINLDLSIAWNVDSENYGNQRLAMDYEKERVYVTETWNGTMSAIDMKSGKLLWRSNEIVFSDTNAVFDEKYVYNVGWKLPGEKEVIFVQLDKDTGDVVKTKKLGEDREILARMNSLSFYNDTLYWGGGDHFVHAYNTQDDADSYKVWGSEDVTADIMGDIVPYNGRLYFVSEVYPYIDEPKPSRLISMLPDGTDVKELEIPADFMGVSANCTQFYKGKLYLNGLYFICVDPETMQVEWKLEDPEKKGLGGFYGFAIYNDRIYAGVGGGSEDAFVCIDTKTGKVIWREKIDTNFYGSILYPPQVYEGYIYQPLQSCLLVLNAKNGKYIGRDERIRTGSLAVGVTERYNDLMIFSGRSDGELSVIAVKMDMHTR
ncbi:MAG: PQQ-binding-like beta-propeller repeat protein [Spirochaetales bacterium]|nr:PQQ-binding-like beta-propeller repeat protein [Spirochaetales bacterium]MBQ2125972.1 PQQ-binding-like beta-propeller repeat protein [Spirochaetales bacterium]